MHRYEQSKYLANSLKSDVVDEINEFNKKQGIELRGLQTSFKKLEKDLKTNYFKTEDVYLIFDKTIKIILFFKKNKNKYVKASKLAQDACLVYEIMRNSKDGNIDRKYMQESKVLSYEKASKDIENSYKCAINEYNDYLDYYNNQTVNFLYILENKKWNLIKSLC